LQNAVNEGTIVVFSKSWCGYSRKAKKLLAEEYPEVTPVIFELDEREDGQALQDYLLKKTGQRTVPNVFITRRSYALGSDDLAALHRAGGIKSLLN
ncbi:glutaredoxin, partial [Multifurca ochricompacta]